MLMVRYATRAAVWVVAVVRPLGVLMGLEELALREQRRHVRLLCGCRRLVARNRLGFCFRLRPLG